MRAAATYNLRFERRIGELQQSIIRILLSVITSIVLVKLYYDLGGSDQNVLQLKDLLFVAGTFILYSVVVYVFELFLPEYIHVTMATTGVTDIILITILMNATIPSQIPFYIWYIFYVVNVSTKFGWQFSVMALSASIVSFSWAVGMYSPITFSPFALGSIGYLLVLAFMFGQMTERQLNYQASLAVVNEFRAELAGIVTSREIMVHVLKRTKELLNVEHAFFLPAHRGADASQSIGLRSQGADSVILSTFREDGGLWNVQTLLREQRPYLSNKLHKDHSLPDGVAQKLKLHHLGAAPMIVRTVPVGVLYVANRKEKRLSNSDLLLLEIIATQIAPVVENALLWERLREAAAAEERLRIARDLHDNVLQTLAAINIHLERCRILIGKDSNRALEGIEKIHDIATHGLAEVRTYLGQLRMFGPEPVRFESVVRKLCEDASSRSGIKTNLDIELPSEGLTQSQSTITFQIIRELVNNSVQHSHAKNINIKVKVENQDLVSMVEDDGEGFEVDTTRAAKASIGHLGLVGVEERVRSMEGTFTLTSKPGEGTKAVFTLPL